MATEKPLKIVKLIAENVKRISAISITPNGNLVHITGKNRSGKTSTLDAIWWTLTGVRNIQADPIRAGQEKATIKLDMGELVATRTIRRTDDGAWTSTITVESPDGGRYSKPQTILDSIVGELTMDPLDFVRKSPKEKFDALRAFVTEVDFDEVARLNKTDFDRRTEINRQAKEKAGQLAGIPIPEVVPKERVDESALVDEIASVGDFNAQLERRAERRQSIAAEAQGFREDAQEARNRAAELRKQADALDAQAEANDAQAKEREDRIANAEPLPLPKDATEVRARLDQAKRTNALIDQLARRADLKKEVGDLRRKADALTKSMEDRDAEKRAKIAAAKLPVQGIEFAEESLLLNGVPFEQASDAEQLRAAVAIAMAANPRLKVIRVRDGSLLDEDGIRLLAEMADAHDCQVWLEAVDSSGRVGIVLEDGHVASTPESRAQQQAAE